MTEHEFVENEIVDMATASDVLPFCVYHFVNLNMGTYLGYLAGPSVTRNKDGKLKYTCAPPKQTNPHGKGWTLAFKFYAFNPMIRPIPNGMSLFCAERKHEFPWNTTRIRMVYDPFDINDHCVYFIAYTKPTPWTKPLYVHVQGTYETPINSFPSWNINSPVSSLLGKYVQTKTKFFSTQPYHRWIGASNVEVQLDDTSIETNRKILLNWHHASIFPFYVLSPDIFGEDYEKILFTCHNAHCFPHNPMSDYIKNVSVVINKNFRADGAPIPRRLSECVTRCNQVVPSELGGGRPFDLLALISAEMDNIRAHDIPPSMGKRLSKVSPIIITLLVIILVASLAVIVYLSINKK